MATIYRFIVEQKEAKSTGGDSRKSSARSSGGTKKGAAKKGKYVTILGSAKGGVEANRKMRAINPLINKATGGYWEKATRVGRAGLGLIKFDAKTGAFAGLSSAAVAIIIAFIIQMIMKWQQAEIQKAQKLNALNYKMLENGFGAVHGEYSISANLWNGRQTYNQNK